MSKKTPQPQASPPPGGGVDFLVRTMIEREATGKRRIRPKNVEDLLQQSIQDESDDPDFDLEEESDSGGSIEESDDSSNNSDEDDEDEEKEKKGDDSDESDDEDYKGKEVSSSSSNNEESEMDSDSSQDESDSDGPGVTKKSALRETLQKLNNETNEFLAKRPVKKKRKKIKSSDKSSPKSSKSSKKVAEKNTKSKSSKPKAEGTKKVNKKPKNKKVVATKKTKISKKFMLRNKKKKKVKNDEGNSRTKRRSIGSLLQDAYVNQKENRKEIEVTKPICSACLGDKSDDSNEIVECDSCGISVHEACYGLFPDNASISSGSGSSSCTEPWFCDVCKSGSDNIYCELCPVEGGLFKESIAGRWVHLVCAMYTQGISVQHDSSINLYEINYSRWGSHNCAACENERQARTGIAISCDAGMCRTYFHATCAQKRGLLSDPSQVDFSEADPYYVSCKLHTNRETMKRRIKLFNTLQEQLRVKKERKELEGLPAGSNADQARIFRKLSKVRNKTALKRAQFLTSLDNVPLPANNTDQTLPPTWINGNKKQRLLHTAAKLANDHLRKIERLGEDLVAHELEVKNEKIISNVKRKWNVLPAMSVEYSAYYLDRENRISAMLEQYEKSNEENHELMDKEISLKDVWETHAVNQMAMQEETDDVSVKLESLVNIIQFVCPVDKKLSTKLNQLARPKELGGRRKSPSMSRGERKSPTPRRSSTSKKSQKTRLSPSPSRAGKTVIAVCATCSKSDGQHLITRCDKCRRHYHLGCLDPPLTRMPKRSRQCGWMCSDCCDPPSEVDDQVDTEAPRTLRGRTKIHKPRKYRGSDESEDDIKPETDAKPVTKKAKINTSSFSSPEPSSLIDLLPVSNSSQKNSPVDRRRRSGSANIALSLPLPELNSPVLNGPTVKSSPHSSKTKGKGKAVPQAGVDPLVQVQLQDGEPKAKKAKKSTTPKAPKQSNQEEMGTKKKKSAKRKASDGPLTTFKVNGLNDASIPIEENGVIVEQHGVIGLPIVLKQRRPKKKKVEKPAIMSEIGNEVTNNETIQVALAIPNPNISKIVKPKKPRKKKEPVVNSESPSSASPKQENIVIKIEKVKKPRKKKEPSMNGVVHTEGEAVTPKPEGKKVKKKAKASPVLQAQPASLAERDESSGVNVSMEEVTSQFLVNKVKNDAVKTTKKRKLSTAVSPTTTTGNNSACGTDSLPEVKEKSVPPKKRKRAPSNAQLQHSVNSVDNVIESVVNFAPEQGLQNGNPELQSNGLSSFMQGISPNRQGTSGQHIMQGKAMGSGVNSGEMVTVDASFLIDGAGHSNHDTVSTFYSSNHSMSTTVTNNDGGVAFQIPNANSSNHSENVIRLQYVDQGDAAPSSIPDSMAMPPPATSNMLSTENIGVCAKCTKSDDKTKLVICDKCRLEYHFSCLTPPLQLSPRKKGTSWFCEDCF